MIRKLVILIFLVICGFGAYIARPLYLPLFAQILVADDSLRKADAIIVLGGDDTQGSRVFEAVSLYREGWGEQLLLSGGPIAWGVNAIDVMREQAETLGVPSEKIISVPTMISGGRMRLVDSTLEESRLLLSECRKHGYTTVIVVTSNFHTRRARRIFNRVFEDSGIEVLVHPSPDASFRVEEWWTRRTDAKVWWLEVQKLVFSYLEAP